MSDLRFITAIYSEGKLQPFGAGVPKGMSEEERNQHIASGVLVDAETFKQYEARKQYHVDAGDYEPEAHTKALQEVVPVYRSKFADKIQKDYMAAMRQQDTERAKRAEKEDGKKGKHTEEDAADDQRSEEIKKQTELPAAQGNDAARLKELKENSK